MERTPKRLQHPSFADLLDQLTIDQIKEVLKPEHSDSYVEEMGKIAHDLNILIEEKQIRLSARLVRTIIVLAQINLHIWHTKDIMTKDPNRFEECTKLAHQLNGIRNQVKNIFMEEAGLSEAAAKKTNIGTDNLEGWTISL